MSFRFWLTSSGIVGALAVIAGAFGAHGLEGKIDSELMEAYQTGALYHLIHAPALLGVAILIRSSPGAAAYRTAGWSFLAGIAVFSGSLYLLALTGLRWLGAITPIGGTALIIGWAALAVGAWRSSEAGSSGINQT